MEHTTITISDIVENDVLSLMITSKANVAQIIGRNAEGFNVIISEGPLNIPPELLRKAPRWRITAAAPKALLTPRG